MKIAFFEVTERDAAAASCLKTAHELSFEAGAIDAETTTRHADADIISTFIRSPLNAAVLAKFPKLRMISLRSAGFDNVDLACCRARGITVCNAAGYGDASVAEHVFALLLGLGKHLVASVEQTRRGNFVDSPAAGFELFGKTLGVIGTGRIGRHTIAIARGFGMNVLAYDAHPRADEAARLGFRYDTLRNVLGAADIITLHVPSTPETENMISDEAFAAMKQGAVLINTARGSVVDAEAMVRALSSGKLAGAGLDVLPNESLIRTETQIFDKDSVAMPVLQDLLADHALLNFSNVLVTPHNAYNTQEALDRIIAITLDNIRAFVEGAAINLVA